ncbi:MAG: DNA-directed RNA polymerase subunit beta', partial [Candidatus Aureabacteria bacterium]|nr:DNA-directed RNA polymerase subunit beta' [Candidatus Auribacterota bacterium]
IPPDLRPLVPLEGGRFATSDLNDLYRRVINRNNRLKNILKLKTPEVIVRNEKRMLQEAVDALFDNGRHGRPVLGSGNRPLKSFAEMLKGKQGRFRQNLLGKRVDYSGRSVIVIGPELKLHQCGLPKIMALELFEPFIIKRLKEEGHVHTIRSAKKMIEQGASVVWDILEEVTKDHPVLLNRAPTLHRLGIQAFEPKLIEGKAIRIHPLVCTAFNADFDGDQMAVHVPLSNEAQLEAKVLILSSNNIFSPANGRPIATPSQDIILGLYYLTMNSRTNGKTLQIFSDTDEVLKALDLDKVHLHDAIKVRIRGKIYETTPGRVVFNEIFPEEVEFINEHIKKKKLSEIISFCYQNLGNDRTVEVLDALKLLGFQEATRSGISLGIKDMIIPERKVRLIDESKKEVEKIERQYRQGSITEGERYNKVVDIWTHTTDTLSDYMYRDLKYNEGKEEVNPLFVMVDSGARGSRQQIRQLAGMRGLMAKPSGEIIESPIISNFREGLSVLEYFLSTHGARKGLADTALKTADSGYLTRRLVDVAQDIIVTEENCNTLNGITARAVYQGDEEVVSLKERIVGRIALEDVIDTVTGDIVVASNQEIDEERAEKIASIGLSSVKIRSALTCETRHGICRKCYGWNLASGHKMCDLGDAVGIIAAQSIGEPGTQLTMRTFHIGGTASQIFKQPQIIAKNKGVIKYHDIKFVKKGKQNVVLNKNGVISIYDKKGKELEKYSVALGAEISMEDGQEVQKGDVFVKWDPYNLPILTERDGMVAFNDIKDDITVRKELDASTGLFDTIVIDHKEDLHPQIVITDENKQILAYYSLPTGAHIVVNENAQVVAGQLLAKTPRKIIKTKDITGGLPRVAELFEARKPKNAAEIARIDGIVEFGESKKGKRKVIVRDPDTGVAEEHLISLGKHLTVHRGDRVRKGQQLTEGPVIPQEILSVCGSKELQEYLLNEIQEVYRLQGVQINYKHVELIIRQMLRKVRVTHPGDTMLVFNEEIDRFKFEEENRRAIEEGFRPAEAEPILLGITRASLSTDSFISAASFQETTRVLTDAASQGKIDPLAGFKENVIMGHIIPAGTGFGKVKDFTYVKVDTEKDAEQEAMEEIERDSQEIEKMKEFLEQSADEIEEEDQGENAGSVDEMEPESGEIEVNHIKEEE